MQLNLVGPLYQIIRTVTNEVSKSFLYCGHGIDGIQIQRQASNRLREHFAQPHLVAATPRAATQTPDEDETRDNFELEERVL